MTKLFFSLALVLGTLGIYSCLQGDSPMPSQALIVILLGPPGSGKGTQAVRLTKELGIPHISTGDLFRENMGKNTELGQKAKTFINAGKLVPDELVLDMLFDRVSKPDAAKGYLLDGFPRTLPQAEAFGKSLRGEKVVVLNLDVPDEVIVKRLEGRRTCKNCGNIHHLEFSPPKSAGICDKCGGELVQRSDDTAEVIKERLRVYHAQTKPLVAYYQKMGILHTVDGTKAPDEIFKQLISLVRAQ